ncbi:Pleckstrin homology domain-containing family G member 4B [Manis javanica]|nr:Pleckstrin homology domain-containing family G member 4B [Manis javanica]
MAEMISTEREYVRSLGYVIGNYFPEMERAVLPQDLHGKSHVIFGNGAELHDFQGWHFRRELECCELCPLAMGQGFLRHEEQLGLYTLYSKNKPQADALLHSHSNTFFKVIPRPREPRHPQPGCTRPPLLPMQDKQRELGDKMDLDSYLLKPVQRMELRMQEVVCMGMGNKLFVDIKPSHVARSDQAADYITKETESQTQMSTAVPAPGGQAAPFKRPHSTISESSTPSSSSQPSTLGPWRLHGPGCPAHVGPLSSAHCHWPCDIPACIEEDEQEQVAGSQPSTSMTPKTSVALLACELTAQQ